MHVLIGTDGSENEVGDVASMICKVADDLSVDAIVVGSHARSTLGRPFSGSVSEHVVRHAPCPVVVVREEATSGAPQRG